MPSDDAVVAQYSLGAALSCDALEWKYAVGRETLSCCLLRCGDVLGGIDASAVLGWVVSWARNVLKYVSAAYDVVELKAWGRGG